MVLQDQMPSVTNLQQTLLTLCCCCCCYARKRLLKIELGSTFQCMLHLAVFWCHLCHTEFLLRQNFHETLLVVSSPLRMSIVLLQMAMREECLQTRNQDFMWEGANEAKVDQTNVFFIV